MRKKDMTLMGLGILMGLTLARPASAAVRQLTATPSAQRFYLDGQQAQFEAYAINGHNYVKLRDIGKVAQAMSWLYEHGVLIDYNVDRAGFMNQLAGEFLAAYKMYHDVYGWAGWITDWNSLTINTIIDSADNGVTGKTSLDIANEVMDLVLNYPQYFMKYHLWIYEWSRCCPTILPPIQQFCPVDLCG